MKRFFPFHALLFFFAVCFASFAEEKGRLSASDLSPGASDAFFFSNAAGTDTQCDEGSGVDCCEGTLQETYAGVTKFTTSYCKGRYAGKASSTRYGIRFDTFHMFRSILNENQLVLVNSNAGCTGGDCCPTSGSKSYNWLLVRARPFDNYSSPMDMSLDTTYVGGTITYNHSQTVKWSGSSKFSLNLLDAETKTNSNAYGARLFGSSTCSAGEFKASAVTDFTAANRPLGNYGYWLIGKNVAFYRQVSADPVIAVAFPKPATSLSASGLMASKNKQVFTGNYTGFTTRGVQVQRNVMLIPDVAGTTFTISEVADPSNPFAVSTLGTLACTNLDEPSQGFCRGTLSLTAVPGFSGKATCMMAYDIGNRDLVFCSAQNPSADSNHRRALVTIAAVSSRKSVLAMSVTPVHLDPNASSGQLCATVENMTSRAVDTLTLTGNLSGDFSAVSLSGSVTAPFSGLTGSVSACGTSLPAFSKCKLCSNVTLTTQKVSAHALTLTFGDTPSSIKSISDTAVATRGVSNLQYEVGKVTQNKTPSVKAVFANGTTQNIDAIKEKLQCSGACTSQVGTRELAYTLDGLDNVPAVGNVLVSTEEELCYNEEDDDNDGTTDCQDNDCDSERADISNASLLCNYGTERDCDDSFDNDKDNATDCDDSDCVANPLCAQGCSDNDVDGYSASSCGGSDCNDYDSSINPGASETCSDSFDNNCNGLTDEGCSYCWDMDGDGYSASSCGGSDCNDVNSDLNTDCNFTGVSGANFYASGTDIGDYDSDRNTVTIEGGEFDSFDYSGTEHFIFRGVYFNSGVILNSGSGIELIDCSFWGTSNIAIIARGTTNLGGYINEEANLFDSSSLTGTITGHVEFYDNSFNAGLISSGSAYFGGSSYNLGTVDGDATFNDSSFNAGTVTGTANYNGFTGWIGNAPDGWNTINQYFVLGRPSCGDSDSDGYSDASCGGDDCDDGNSAFTTDCSSDVVLYLPFDSDLGGAQGTGSPAISNTTAKFGGGSAHLPADLGNTASNYLTVPGVALNSNKFTIEAWFYPTTFANGGGNGGYQTIFSGAEDFTYGVMMNTSGNLQMWASGGSGWNLVDWGGTLSSSVNLHAWNHIAFVRDQTVFRLYLNGQNVGEVDSGSLATMASGSGLRIGVWGNGQSPINDGYIDEFTITKGYAKYTSNFTPESCGSRSLASDDGCGCGMGTGCSTGVNQLGADSWLWQSGHYYGLFSSSPLSWEAARSTCAAKGAYLVSITSSDENAVVYNLVSQANSYNTWIGATDSFTEGNWRWVNGEPWSYTNWASGEPNNANGGENFAQIYDSGNSQWVDYANYGTPRAYVCEWDNGEHSDDLSDPSSCNDSDSDGYSDISCGGSDCNDSDYSVNPGASETCGDWSDNNCNGQTDEGCSYCSDMDGDGYSDISCGGSDCNDWAWNINPGASESCGDWSDNNCNGQTDEGCSYCSDMDGDGYSDISCGGSDCNDWAWNINPGASETCGDWSDNNCNGQTDEGCSYCSDSDSDGVCSESDCDDNYSNAQNDCSGNTVLNLNFDSDFSDSSSDQNGVTPYGSSTISNTIAKFGGGSAYFDGSSETDLRINGNSHFDFGTGDFTIESWVYLPSLIIGSEHHLVTCSSDTNGLCFGFHGNGAYFGVARRNVNWDLETPVSISPNTWYHIAVSRVGGTMRLFLNGALVASGSNSQSYTFGNTLHIGSHNGSHYLNGFVDDLKIIKGYAKYTDNFTPESCSSRGLASDDGCGCGMGSGCQTTLNTPFFDNLDNIDNWINNGVTNSSGQVQITEGHNLALGASLPANFTMTVKYQTSGGYEARAGIYFKSDSSTIDTGNSYSLLIGTNWAGHEFALGKLTPAPYNYSNLVTQSASPLSRDTWYYSRITYLNGRIVVDHSTNGSSWIREIDTTDGSPLSGNLVYFRAHDWTTLILDEVSIDAASSVPNTDPVCTDADSDGYGDNCTNGSDCNDSDASTNPGASETCSDSVDNNCDGQTDEGCIYCSDNDGDGYSDGSCGGNDCNDWAWDINPGASETCDGSDNNCNGATDEGCSDGSSEVSGGGGDPYFDDVRVLVNADQNITNYANGGTPTLTFVGGAHYSTSDMKFGSASAQYSPQITQYCDGWGCYDQLVPNYLKVNDNSRTIPANYTAEFWIKPDSNWGWDGATKTLYNRGVFDYGSSGIQVYYYNGNLYFSVSIDSYTYNGSGEGYCSGGGNAHANVGALSASTWHHVAAVREGNALRLYFNGTRVATATMSANSYTYWGTIPDCSASSAINMGDWGPVSEAFGVNLYYGDYVNDNVTAKYDDIRLSNRARYSDASFTLPTSPYPTTKQAVAPTISLSPTSYTLTAGSAMTAIVPSLTVGTIDSCTVSPSLPAGLSLNTSTCGISGTPTYGGGSQSYTITPSNSVGTGNSVSVSIQVNGADSGGAYYSNGSFANGIVANHTNDKTVLYIPSDTNFNDYSTKSATITEYGGVTVSNSNRKYGAGSFFSDSSNKFLKTASNSNFAFPGDFTVEAWTYFTDNSRGYQGIVSTYTTGDQTGWILYTETSNRLHFAWSAGSGWINGLATDIPPLNTWQHIAVSRSGGTIRLFVDGVLKDSKSDSTSIASGTTLEVGGYNYFPGGERGFRGYIDDVRVTKGAGIYTSSFTPPTGALGTYGTLYGCYSAGVSTGTIDSSGTGYCDTTYYINGVAYPGLDYNGSGTSGGVLFVNGVPVNGMHTDGNCYLNGSNTGGVVSGTGWCSGDNAYYLNGNSTTLSSSGTGTYNGFFYSNGQLGSGVVNGAADYSVEFSNSNDFTNNFAITTPADGIANVTNGQLEFRNPNQDRLTGYHFKNPVSVSAIEIKFTHPSLYPNWHCPTIAFSTGLGTFTVAYDPKYSDGGWCDATSIKTSFGSFPMGHLAGGQAHIIKLEVNTQTQTATLTIDGTSQTYTNAMFAQKLTNFEHSPNYSWYCTGYTTSIDYVRAYDYGCYSNGSADMSFNANGTGACAGTYYIGGVAYPGLDSNGTGTSGGLYYSSGALANGLISDGSADLQCYLNGVNTGGVSSGNGWCIQDSTYYLGNTPTTLSSDGSGSWLGMVYSNGSLANGFVGTAETNKTVLLLHMEGSNNSTTFTDSSLRAFTGTVHGNSIVSMAQSKVGGASSYFDGDGDYVSYSSSTDFAFGTGDFTVEFWMRPSSLSGTRGMVTTAYPTDQHGVWVGLSNNSVYWLLGDGTWAFSRTASSVAVNTWNHIAVTRSGSTARLFLNGNQIDSVSNSSNLTNINNAIHIGGRPNGSQYFSGYIDEVRVTKGAALYTSNFTPSTSSLTNYGVTYGCYTSGTDSGTVTSSGTGYCNNTYYISGTAYDGLDSNGNGTSGGLLYSSGALANGLSNGTYYVNGVAVYAPDIPTSVMGAAGNAEVVVSWTVPSSNGGSAITDYVIQYSSDSGSNWTTFSDGTSTATSVSVTGLTNCTSYVFRVAAVNIGGAGDYSLASTDVSPNANAGDPYFGDVRVLVNADENVTNQANGGTPTVTFVGGANYSTSDKKFGVASAQLSPQTTQYCDGWGCYDQLAPNYLKVNETSRTIPANYTVEFWVKPDSDWSGGTTRTLYQGGVFDMGVSGLRLYHYNNRLYLSLNSYNYGYYSGQGDWACSQYGSNYADVGTLSANTWYHIAIVREGNALRLYFNGNRVGNSTISASLDSWDGSSPAGGCTASGDIALNNYGNISVAFGVEMDYGDYVYSNVTAKFDDIRISNRARYSDTTYTVPTEAFPKSASSGAEDSSCSGATEVCNDGTDNDSDGYTDCADTSDCYGQVNSDYRYCGLETHSYGGCVLDGVDDDSDGYTDCADPDCYGGYVGWGAYGGTCDSGSETNCSDGYDFDGDGLTDGSDSDCVACVDSDSDTFGNNCSAGSDCNDSDSNLTSDCSITGVIGSNFYANGTDVGDVDPQGQVVISGYDWPWDFWYGDDSERNFIFTNSAVLQGDAGISTSGNVIFQNGSRNEGYVYATQIVFYDTSKNIGFGPQGQTFGSLHPRGNVIFYDNSYNKGNGPIDGEVHYYGYTGVIDDGYYIGGQLTTLDSSGSGTWNGQIYVSGSALLPPGDPEFEEITPGNASVHLLWIAPDNHGSAITDYVVQYSSNSGSTWTTFAHGTSTDTSTTVTGLTNGTAYIFRVAAVSAVGTGAWSHNVYSSFTPGYAGSGVWGSDFWDNGTDIGDYSEGVVTITSNLSSSFSYSGTENFAFYDVDFPSGATLTTTGSVTFNSTAKNYGTITGNLGFWGDSENHSSVYSADFYEVSSNYGTVQYNASFADSSSNRGTVTGTGYFYDDSTNTGTVGTKVCGYGNTVCAVAPSAPTSVTGTSGNGVVSLSWSAPSSTGGSAITDYVIQYSSNSGSTWTTFADGTSTATSTAVTGLTNGTAYIFKVAAVNAVGTGSYSSNSSSVTPAGAPTGAPTLTGYNTTVTSNGQTYYEYDFCSSSVNVSFSAGANGGSAITNYQLSQASWNGSNYVPTTWNDFSPAKTTSPISFTGLNNTMEYFYFIRAKNAVGTGPTSGLIYLAGCNVY